MILKAIAPAAGQAVLSQLDSARRMTIKASDCPPESGAQRYRVLR
jgi:hypothetical protein